MPTDKEHVVRIEAEQVQLKERYKASLRAFRALNLHPNASKAEKIQSLEEIKGTALDMFNHWEAFIAKSDFFGVHPDKLLATGIADDCCVILHGIVQYYRLLQVWSAKLEINCTLPQKVAYASTQRMIALHCPAEAVADTIKILTEAGLGIHGFENPVKLEPMPHRGEYEKRILDAVAEGAKEPRIENQQNNFHPKGSVSMTNTNENNSIVGGRDVIGAASGRSTVGDVTIYQSQIDNSQKLDPEAKSKLKGAREEIEKLALPEADKKDLLHDFSELTAELEKELPKEKPEVGRLSKFWKRVKDAAPSVTKILGTAASIWKIVELFHGHQ